MLLIARSIALGEPDMRMHIDAWFGSEWYGNYNGAVYPVAVINHSGRIAREHGIAVDKTNNVVDHVFLRAVQYFHAADLVFIVGFTDDDVIAGIIVQHLNAARWQSIEINERSVPRITARLQGCSEFCLSNLRHYRRFHIFLTGENKYGNNEQGNGIKFFHACI